MKTLLFTLLLPCFLFSYSAIAMGTESGNAEYSVVTQGTRELLRPDGSDFVKILVEAANLGGNEVEVAEITFGPNYQGNGHPHGSMEIFYVLSGELTHVVNGHGATLKPGMVGIVRPGDTVEHINTTDVPVKTLVIWVPGGEIKRSFGAAEMTPIDRLSPEGFGK
jgi:mannose-6-phosphate isomerase-like protein (cupin superfamily)